MSRKEPQAERDIPDEVYEILDKLSQEQFKDLLRRMKVLLEASIEAKEKEEKNKNDRESDEPELGPLFGDESKRIDKEESDVLQLGPLFGEDPSNPSPDPDTRRPRGRGRKGKGGD